MRKYCGRCSTGLPSALPLVDVPRSPGGRWIAAESRTVIYRQTMQILAGLMVPLSELKRVMLLALNSLRSIAYSNSDTQESTAPRTLRA
jgi:hypothetical protein